VILLDTNVISELLKPKPEPNVETWFLRFEEESCIASVVVAELAYGIAKLDAGMRKTKLKKQVEEWRFRFAARTYVFDVTAALVYGDIQAKARKLGKPMSVPDAQLAAIAVDQGLKLATRNVKDFQTTGIVVVNPWT
jgi:toxin FitB